MAANVTDGIAAWLGARSAVPWRVRFEYPVVGRRRPRVLPHFVIHTDGPGVPTVAVAESNWSDITKGRIRRYTIRRWLENTLATLGEATRAVNRKTEVDLLLVLLPMVAIAFAAFAVLAFVADTAQRAGGAIVPLMLLIALAATSFFVSLVVPFVPQVRRGARLFREGLGMYANHPEPLRHAGAILELMSGSQYGDPNNAVLVFASLMRGVLATTGWLLAATLYAVLALGTSGTVALERATAADWCAFVAVALALRFGRLALKRTSLVYEPLEDIYAYIDPSREARLLRKDAVRQVTADLQSFLAASNFDAVVLTGHSLGSVLLLDALIEVVRDVECGRYDGRHLAAIEGVVLYGSPLGKILSLVHTIRPERFTTELLRLRHAFALLSEIADTIERPWCHNVYYLTDIVSEKVTTDDESIANYLLRTPLRPWSHGAYHADRSFWSIVFGVTGLTETLTLPAAAGGSADDPSSYAVPSRWPSPAFPQVLIALAKLGLFLVAVRFAGTAIAHGANPTVTVAFLGVVTTVLVLAIRD